MASLEDEAQLDLMKEIKFKEMERQDVIFHAGNIDFPINWISACVGETARNFFMLLKGSVYVIKKKQRRRTQNKIQAINRKTVLANMLNSTDQLNKPLSNQEGNSIQRISILQLLDQEANESSNQASATASPQNKIKRIDSQALPEEDLHQAFPSHVVVNVLFAPTYFGEIALNDSSQRYFSFFFLNQQLIRKPRTATIVCREKCYLAILGRTSYFKTLCN